MSFNDCSGSNICCTVAGTTGATTQAVCTSTFSDASASMASCPSGTQQTCLLADPTTCSPGGATQSVGGPGPCNFACQAISGSTVMGVCVAMQGANCDAGSPPGDDGGATEAGTDAESDSGAPTDDGAAADADAGTAPMDAAGQ
jgi:hypothetical protein